MPVLALMLPLCERGSLNVILHSSSNIYAVDHSDLPVLQIAGSVYRGTAYNSADGHLRGAGHMFTLRHASCVRPKGGAHVRAVLCVLLLVAMSVGLVETPAALPSQ